MRQQGFTGLLSSAPNTHQTMLNGPNGRLFGNANIGDPVQLTLEEVHFVGGSEVLVVRDLDVSVTSDEVEHILLQVGAGAGDGGDVPGPNHVGQGTPDFGGTHRTGQGQKNTPALSEVVDQRRRGTGDGPCVEVAVMLVNKGSNGHGSNLLEKTINPVSSSAKQAGESLHESPMKVGSNALGVGVTARETIDGEQTAVSVTVGGDVALINEHHGRKTGRRGATIERGEVGMHLGGRAPGNGFSHRIEEPLVVFFALKEGVDVVQENMGALRLVVRHGITCSLRHRGRCSEAELTLISNR